MLKQLVSTTDKALAERYGFAYVDNFSSGYCLSYSDERLALHVPDKKLQPIIIDFLSGKARHRRFHNGGGQLITKAIGVKTLELPHVLDVTAGLGEDAFVLACLGCRVTMVERCPVMVALLEDALKRFYAADESAGISLKLIFCDSLEYVSTHGQDYQVIYLDPMYPDSGNSAQNKKEMRIFRDLVGEDPDAVNVLDLALTKAQKRVIVKRPRHGNILSDRKPSHQYKGKSSRFDMYNIV